MTYEYQGGDGDAIAAHITDDVRRTKARAARLGELSRVVREVRGKASSHERDISVEVDSAGRVTRLQISNQAAARGGSRLAAELMTLFASAHADVQRRVGEAAIAVLDADDPAIPLYESVGSTESSPSSAQSAVPETGAEVQPQTSRRTGGLW